MYTFSVFLPLLLIRYLLGQKKYGTRKIKNYFFFKVGIYKKFGISDFLNSVIKQFTHDHKIAKLTHSGFHSSWNENFSSVDKIYFIVLYNK